MDIQILAEKFYQYSLHIRGYSKETIRRYKQVLGFYCKCAGVSKIEEITNENVRSFLFYGRTVRHWTPNTFIIYHKSLVVFSRWCQSEGHLDKNPVIDIEVPKLEKRLPKKFTRQDAARLLEVVYNYPYKYKFVRYRNHALFATFIFAGLRLKELLKLKFADVDVDNLTIFVNQGKGSKDRIVPMSYTLAQTLKRYIEERNRLRKTCPEFFTSLTLNRGLSKDGLRHIVAIMRKALGLEFTIHKLRHTFATLMLEGGCDIFSLSRMMGHSDIKTTTIYLYASAEHLRSQMTKHPLNDLVR